MLFDRKNFAKLHSRWFVFAVLVGVACAAWYTVEALGRDRLPGGSSLPGLVFGILAGLICLFETALALRRTWLFRTQRWLLRAQTWMKAHIWLGLLAVPLVAMHSGFDFGGTFSSLLAWAFIFVILSGVFGLVMQNIIPRLMINVVPAETVFSQINEVGHQFAEDAERLAWLHGGLDRGAGVTKTGAQSRAFDLRRIQDKPVVGAPRVVGTVVERAPRQEAEAKTFDPSPAIDEAVKGEVGDFLRTGKSPSGKLGSAQRIEWYFEDLRARVRPEARPAVDEIEQLCERRRQFNLQWRLHYWLHVWVTAHVFLTAVMMWLLLGHIVLALRYS